MFSWLRNRRNKKRIQNRTKEQELIQRIGDIILYELPIEEQDNWLKSVVEQGLYIPTHVDGDLNEKLKEMIVEKTLEKPESVSSDAMGKLQKGADVAKAQENPVDLTRERWQKEKETNKYPHIVQKMYQKKFQF